MQTLVIMSDGAQEKLISVEEKVSTILDLLQGNKLNKADRGLVGTVDDHEERITSLEKWKDRLIWTVVGMGLPASVGIVEILKKIFTK